MTGFIESKKIFLYALIGALIAASLLAVITVLIGQFGDLSVKVLLTLLMVVLHSIFSLSFIWTSEKNSSTFEHLSFFVNTLFVLVVLSFITSLLAIWLPFPAGLTSKLYSTYFIAGFAALHADILSKVLRKEQYIDNIVYTNYAFMGLVVLMLLPVVFLADAMTLGDIYYRILAAAGIIDGTLTILAIIFYRLYVQHHPKERSVFEGMRLSGGFSWWVWLLLIYLLFQLISVIMLIFAGSLFTPIY